MSLESLSIHSPKISARKASRNQLCLIFFFINQFEVLFTVMYLKPKPGGRCLVMQLRHLGTCLSSSEPRFNSGCVSKSSFLSVHRLGVLRCASCTWVFAMRVDYLYWDAGSWFWSYPALDVEGLWRVNQCLEGLCKFVSLFQINTNN